MQEVPTQYNDTVKKILHHISHPRGVSFQLFYFLIMLFFQVSFKTDQLF